ncbi:MAG TPA: ATP-binding protein [Anaerolineales bacterium]
MATDGNHRYSLSYHGYLFGSITIPLIIAFLLLQREATIPIPASNLLIYWQSSLAICLVFTVHHGAIILIDIGTYKRDVVPLSLRETLIFASLEILPIPFIVLIAQSYPSIGAGAIILLGSTVITTGFLLTRNEVTSGQLERRMQDLTTLNRVSRTLRSTLEMEKLLEAIHTQVTNLLGVDNFYVALYDSEARQIWYPLAVKRGKRQDWPRRTLTNRLTDRVVEESKPILLGHHAGDAMTRIGFPAGEDSPFAWMGVPLITSNRTIGCLALFSLSEEVEFTQADIDLLTILSGQTSVAIENALLFQRVQQRAGQLESLVHDLRSPISAVVSAIDVIEDSASIPEDDRLSKQALRIARRSAQRVLSMVESIMDISKFQTNSLILNRAPLDIKKLSVQTLEEFFMQANEFGILMKDEVPDDLAKAYADQGKLKRVITNLLDNALKYTPSGGQIVVSASEYNNNMVMLRVSDTGPGIPEEYRDKIFERFGQVPGQHRREQGYGLGLTYCRLAIEAHGGRIWVEPGPRGGSVFSITLPVAEK